MYFFSLLYVCFISQYKFSKKKESILLFQMVYWSIKEDKYRDRATSTNWDYQSYKNFPKRHNFKMSNRSIQGDRYQQMYSRIIPYLEKYRPFLIEPSNLEDRQQ